MNREVPSNAGVSAERRAFLDAAFDNHFRLEQARDVPAVVGTFAKGGHLQFNGVRYDTPEQLTAFHVGFGFANDDRGLLKDLEADVLNRLHTHDSVIVEFAIRCTVTVPLGGAPAGRRAEFSGCTIYQFDEAGMLQSERAYLDTGGLLPEPIVPAL